MKIEKRRFTVGILVSGILDDFTKLVCRGVMRMAKQLNVNVVVFPGKYLDRDLSDNPELMYEYQFNTIFSYARPENVDAIIVASGSIGCFTSRDHMRKMLTQLGEIPCVLIADKMDGYISVSFDNYSGIKEGLTYLIKKAGCRKIGMIGGSEDNMDVVERKTAFMDALNEHGIPFSEKMYVNGNFSRKSTDAYSELLDNNPGIEAVFCVNDDTAIGLYDEVKKRGLKIGKDIRIFGYDDIILSGKVNPTLSSVQADGALLGEEALKMVVSLIRGEDVTSKVLPTRFIKRDSVGIEEDEEEKASEVGDAEDYFQDIFFRNSHEQQLEDIKSAFVKLIETLFLVYGEGADSLENIMEIQTALNDFLGYGAMEYADINNLMNCLESVYHILRDMQQDKEKKYKLQENFYVIYRSVLRATDYHLGKMLEMQEQENYAMKLFVRDVLQFEKGNDLSYASLLAQLDWLKIKNAYVYTFAEPVMHLYGEQFLVPKDLYLKAVLSEGEVSAVPALKQKVKLKDIYQRAFEDADKRYTYVCMPLFSNEMLYGIILCDLTAEVFLNGEFMINQMSSAVKMITLLKANEAIQQKLEESLLALRENNIALDTLSKSDSLTGILNRRGFYTEAEKLLEKCRKQKSGLLAIYVDMNNLKIINDRYGHEEGDFSLKLISEILSSEMQGVGIAGRIGGDEYACLMEYSMADDGESVINRINDHFYTFNKDSDKPYNITVSVGAFFMGSQDEITLKEALTQADEKLYEVKKYRKKDVAK